MKLKKLILTTFILIPLPSQAAITYVDATDGASGNTRASGLPQSDTSWVVASTASTSQNTWSRRTGVSPDNIGTNNTLYQALPNGNPTNIPQLTTTITGLDDGSTYNVWVFFQDNTGDNTSPYQNWVIAAGLSSTLTTSYWYDNQPLADHNNNPPQLGANGSGTISTSGVHDASTLTFTGTAPILIEGASTTGERRLYGVNLGPVTLSGQTSVDVYIGMLINGSSGTTRTWYDGVGYQLIPEPSTALLGGLSLLFLLRRRRN